MLFTMNNQSLLYAFFGTGALAESVLSALVQAGYMPALVVTKPDALSGRHMQLTAPYIKTWAQMKGVEVFQPLSLKEIGLESPLHSKKFDIFIVASDRKSTRLNSSHLRLSRMPSSA